MKKLFSIFVASLLLLTLAADARGTHGGKSGPIIPFVPTTLVCFGDSITEGGAYVLTGAQYCSVPLLGTALSIGTVQDVAVGGTQACDNLQNGATTSNGSNGGGVFGNATGVVTTPSTSNATLYTIAYGTNDAELKGIGSYEGVFSLCQLANITWLAIPSTSKITAQSCSKTGSWSNDTIPTTGFGVVSTTNSSTLTCSITTQGKPLILYYFPVDGDGGTFTYTIDGGSPVSVNCFTSPAIATQNGATTAIGAVRITGVSAATHSVVITVTSSTSGSNPVNIWGLGSAPSGDYSSQMVTLVGTVIRQMFDQKSGETSAYNTDTTTLVTQLSGDGLPVYLADTRTAVNTTTDMKNTLHPNGQPDGNGHINMKNAFVAVFP